MELKLLTYNIHKGFRVGNKSFVLHEIRELIRSTGADLVFLQEVIGENTRHSAVVEKWPEQSQYEFLADEVWQQYSYGKNSIYDGGHHGNAILSRFPIASWSNLDISTNSIEKRGLLHAEVVVPDSDIIIHACCTHLNLVERSRTLQLDTICYWIEKNIHCRAPLIIAGDFNDWTDRASKILNDKINLSEVMRLKHSRLVGTFPAIFPILKLDRIYVRGFEVIEAEVQKEKVWRKLSDHIPVIATLKLISKKQN